MAHTDREELERILDRHDLPTLLDMLGGICFDKAAHIECNWQDQRTAKVWERLGLVCHKAEVKARKL